MLISIDMDCVTQFCVNFVSKRCYFKPFGVL